MRVVGYVRVSTEGQAERGLGLEVQERALRAWARSSGHRLAAVHRDAGVSGTLGLEHRLGLADALEALRVGSAPAGLVVYRLDRLARDLVVQESILAEVRRMGRTVHSCATAEAGFLNDDPADPSRKLIRQVLGAVAEYDRSMVTLRLAAGRRRKAERGGYAYGSPAFGQRAEGRELVVDEAEAAVVARIAELRAEGASLRALGAVLEAEGHRPKRGTRWHPETLRRVVARL